MTTIKDEILALRTFISPLLPGVRFHLQSEPETPQAGDLSIQTTLTRPETETAAHNRIDRTYQLIYYGATNVDVIDKADLFRQKFTNTKKVNLGAIGYVTIASFSMSRIVKAENGTPAIIIMIELELREFMNMPTSPTVNDIRIKIE